MNTWKRRLLALLSVPLLAVPSAVGVYAYLEPESGPIAAGLAAAGFEVLYIGVNVLIISSPELRRYARNVSVGAVVTAVLMNTIAHYSAPAFDVLELFLSLIASAPLATLAYAVSVLLHRLSEESAQHSIEDARLHVSLAQRDEEIARLTELREQFAAMEAEHTNVSRLLADREQAAATAHDEAARLRAQLASREVEAAKLRESFAGAQALIKHLRETPAPVPTRAAILAYLHREVARGRSRLDVAAELSIAEGTLRGWEKTETNGHAVER